MTTTTAQTTAETLTDEQIAAYRTQGFVHIPGILSPEEAAHFHEVAQDFAKGGPALSNQAIFQQLVNVWRQDEGMKALTLHPNIGTVAEKLAGVPLRIWHDQILIKKPHNGAPTEWHQDQPYWPHLESVQPISCWIALCDVPVERGCMTFIPGSQVRTDLRAQNLSDPDSLFSICPELKWEARVTVPLKAGDCTFHHGRCAHMATPNFTDDPRIAHVVIFMDAATKFSGAPHVVTQNAGFAVGEPLSGELFPQVAEYAAE
ncbi:phytanoyl-CoA dioxygenase family protein [bacterium]|nr:MAG: phytanoyl-CoA dioxygenase family protein [bacterium]